MTMKIVGAAHCFPRQFSSDHSDVVVVDGDDEDVRAVLGASEIYCLLRQFLWRQMTAERRLLTNDPLCQIYLSIYSLSCQINSLSLSDYQIKQNTYINLFSVRFLSIYSLAPLPCQINSLSLSDRAKYLYMRYKYLIYTHPCVHF